MKIANKIVGNILGDRCSKNKKKQELEIREFVIDKKAQYGYRDYKVIKGTLWASGYDERLISGELDIDNMKPGKYRVTFVGEDPKSGSDAIYIKKIERVK